MRQKFLRIIIPLIFLALGLTISYFSQKNKKTSLVSETQEESQTEEAEQTTTSAPQWEEEELGFPSGTSSLSSNAPYGKYTIVETQRITSDKTRLETGEDITFKLTIKNAGAKVKTLTHLCFQHSGGINFGCLLGHTLAPGQEFPISASTRFYSPGVYSVWFIWSQDQTNFYKTVESSSVLITVD